MNEHKILKLIEQSNQLPMIPKQVTEIFNILIDPAAFSINELTTKVSNCENLEGMLISYLNSGNFSFVRSITSLKEAIAYLGAQNIKGILMAFITRLLLPDRMGRAKVFSNSQYWKHCIGTSIAGSMICEKTGLADKYKIFTYGLIHDIGITVLDICVPELLDKVHNLQLKGIHQIVAERMALEGINHAQVGKWLCTKWNLSQEISDIVALHHAPLLATSNKDEVKILHLADTISTNYYERLLGINNSYAYSKEVMSSLGLEQSDIDEIVGKLPDEIEKARRLINFESFLI